jgi:hypothetical protein
VQASVWVPDECHVFERVGGRAARGGVSVTS